MIAKDRKEPETEPIMIRVPVTLLGKVDQLKEKRFYKSRQEIFLEAIRDFINDAEVQA